MTGDSDVRQGVSLKAVGKLVCVRHAEAVLHVVRCRARRAPGPGISVCCAGQQRVSLAVQRAMLQWAMRPFDLGRLLGKCIARRQRGAGGGRCVLQCQSRTLTARWLLRVGGGGRGTAHSVPLCAGPRLWPPGAGPTRGASSVVSWVAATLTPSPLVLSLGAGGDS